MSVFLPDNNWYPQHRNTDLPGLFFSAEQNNNNFYINMFWYIRNFLFRDYMSDYWLDSWEIETEEVSSRFVIAGDRTLNSCAPVKPTIRSINVRLGKLVYGKREHEHFYWCGRHQIIEKLFKKRIKDSTPDGIRSAISLYDLMEKQKPHYYTSITAFNKMTWICKDTSKILADMQIDHYCRELHQELLHYAFLFDTKKLTDESQFRSRLINEYKRRRIQCV